MMQTWHKTLKVLKSNDFKQRKTKHLSLSVSGSCISHNAFSLALVSCLTLFLFHLVREAGCVLN